MLIISKHKDFYDKATTLVDKETVYDRKTELIQDFEDAEYGFLYSNTQRDVNWGQSTEVSSPFILGFCGKEYFGRVVGDNLLHEGSHSGTEVTYGHLRKPTKADRFYYKELYEGSVKIHGREKMDLFLRHKCPVYLIFRHPNIWKVRFVKNPVLKTVEFGKIKDSFTTFQDIHVFLREILMSSEQTVLVEVSEKDKIISKGYDKWSFRRDTHPRKPRNKNKNRKQDNGN